MPSPITTGKENLVGADKLMNNYYKQRMQESEDFLRQMETANQQAYQNARSSYMGMDSSPIRDTSQVYRYDEGDPMASWGSSQYDTQELNNLTAGQLQDTRYENQSSLDVFANGVGKMLGTAATTFVSSLVGLPYGAVEAARQGRWSALWDNDVTQALAGVDNWLEENMTNYKSQKQQNSPWYDPSNLFSMNFIADDVIKNAGFTLGAAASMAVGSGALGLLGRAMGFVNEVGKGTRIANNVASALFSATGEGMIEARQGVEERNKLETQKLEDSLAPAYEALQEQEVLANQEYAMTGDYSTYRTRVQDILAQKQALDQRREAGMQQIQESGKEMGNKILLGNQVLLTAGNLIQFSKLMNAGFDNARHAAETANKAAKPTLVTATREGKGILPKKYGLKGKNLGRTVAATKGILTEGSEEMNQQWIQSASGAAYNEADVNDYWKAKLDPDSYRDTTEGLYTLGQALDRGFKESWGDIDQWEQFVVGGLTGMAGTYAPTKIFNQDKTKSRLNPLRYGEWSGGAYKEVSEFNRKYNQFEENVNDLNRMLADGDFEARILDSVGHTYNEKQKEGAALAGDKKAWEDTDDKQNIMDVQAFLRAGKIDDLRTIYGSMGKDLSDGDIDGIVKRTTKTRRDDAGNIYYDGPYVDEEGNRTRTNDEIRQDVQRNAEELSRKLDEYLNSIDYVNGSSKGQLSKDQEDNLAYLHFMGRESINRMNGIMARERANMPSRFLLKTDKTPEELTQEYASSDLVFTSDENTRKGYVEVDTSLMPDNTFASFFQREVMRGGNINVEFAETAEEKALREEEENTISEEERKKRAIERASKIWREGVERQKRDAAEQRNANIDNIVDAFVENYRRNNPNASEAETSSALQEFWDDILYSGELYNQAGEYFATLDDYMKNPEKVDKAKEKEAEKAGKKNGERKAKGKFAGKTAQQMNQGVAEGTIDQDELDSFAGLDPDDITDDDLRQAQQQAKESQNIRNKATRIKKHIQENLGDNPSEEERTAAEKAMRMVDEAAGMAESTEALDRNAPQMQSQPIDMVDVSTSQEDLDAEADMIQDMLDEAFAAEKKDSDMLDDIPDAEEMSKRATPIPGKETGNDPVAKAPTIVVTPEPAKGESVPFNGNPLQRDAVDKVVDETRRLYEGRNDDGTFRMCTTRNPYGTSSGTYHEMARRQYGEDSREYRRAKALWDYMESQGAFDRVENSSADRLKEGDELMLMVKYLPEVFGKPYDEAVKEHGEDEMAYAMALVMLKNGEVIGDLPLAQFEPTYKNGNPLPDVKTLMTLQEKAFKAFAEDYRRNHFDEVVVKGRLNKDGVGNNEIAFVNSDKPLVVKIRKVIKGVVPYQKGLHTTLNDVFGTVPFELGVRTKTGTTDSIATKRGVMSRKSGIVAPNIGSIGQPYLLMPTPSGERIACPFYMDPFDAESHKDTEFMKALSNTIYYLLETEKMPENKKKTYFQKHMTILEGLLQVKNIKGRSVLDFSRGKVTMNLQNAANPETTYALSVQDTGNNAEIASALAKEMTGIPFNVSLEYINQKLEVGAEGLGKKVYDYNRLIGEIADINLPQNTTHTVNGRFLISLPTQESKSRKAKPLPVEGTVHEIINGRDIEFDVGSEDITAKDANTGEIVDNDDAINLRRAQIRARKLGDRAGDFIQINVRDGTQRYDVKNDKLLEKSRTAMPRASSQPSGAAVEDDMDLDVPVVLKPVSFKATQTREEKKAEGATPSPVASISRKTIDQIEDEVRRNVIVSQRNQEAWEAIPEDMKLKMVNEGIPLQLSYNNKKVNISWSDKAKLKEELKNAKMAAKTGKLSVSEAPKPMQKDTITIQKEKERAARQWLAKNLPTLSSEERTQFVDKMARNGDNAPKMWGSYRSGVIQIMRKAPMGTVYHEAFHYVLDIVLSDEERRQILDLAKAEYGLDNDYAAEERLAGDFRRYSIDENAEGILGRIKRWIRRIMDKMSRYSRISNPVVNQLFWKINNGQMAQKAVQMESFEEKQQEVLREIRNVQQEKYAWRNLDPEVRRNLEKYSGITEEKYQDMSLEEKEQYVKCRG